MRTMSREEMMRKGHRLLMVAGLLLALVGCSEVSTNHPVPLDEKCEVCHGMPPEDLLTTSYHSKHVTELGLGCNRCHYGYDTIHGWKLSELHRNGDLNYDTSRCARCHDYNDCDRCHWSPPKDTERQRRAHDPHMNKYDITCNTCHKGYDLKTRDFPEDLHENDRLDIIFDTKMKPGFEGIFPQSYDSASGTCYNLYCHGAVTIGGKSSVALTDQMATDTAKCSFCHNTTALLNEVTIHSKPAHLEYFKDCLNCHPGFSLSIMSTDSTTHRDGPLNVISDSTCNTKCHSTPHSR